MNGNDEQLTVAELDQLDELDELDELNSDLDADEGDRDLVEDNEPEDDDPPLPRTELVRLTDVVRNDDEFQALKDTRYTPRYRETLQRPVFAAYNSRKCPEFFEAVRSAYAACYFLSEDAHKQDVIEESVAEALRLYVGCEHGLIKSTCTRCESTKSSRFELPFSVSGLKKLTTRIAERMKKRDCKRAYFKQYLQSDGVQEVEEHSLSENISDGGSVEDDLIAGIDAERGHIDKGNQTLMRSLAKIFSKSELKRFLNPPSKTDPRYLRLVEKFRKYFFETPLKTSSLVPI